MAIFLSKRELAQTEPAEKVAFRSPVPTRIISNGEFNPLPQTRRQRQFEERLKELAEVTAHKLGMDRRHFPPDELRHGDRLYRAERCVRAGL
jgi:hypothetical protein